MSVLPPFEPGRGAGQLEYFGCYQVSDEERPRGGAYLCGWTYRAGDPEDATPWRALVGAVAVDLLVSPPEAEFLAQCAAAGFSCWVVGTLVLTRTLAPAFLHVSAPQSAGPRMPPAVAEALARSAMRRALQTLCAPERPPCLALHGTALLEPCLAGVLDGGVATATLFVRHAEEETCAGTAWHTGCDATRLGTSGQRFDLSTRTLRAEAGQRAPEVLRGCLLVDGRPARLLLVLRQVLLATPAPLRTLVLCPREDLPFVAAALEGLPRLRVLTRAADLAADLAAAGVLVATPELVGPPADLGQLTAQPYHRLVSVRWPTVSWHLCFVALAAVRFTTHLALATAEDMHAPPPEPVTVAHLLGVAPQGLQDPSGLAAVLRARVLHLSAEAGLPEVLPYRHERVPLPDAESRELAQHADPFRARLGLFAALCGAPAPRFPQLRGVTPAEHFARLGAPVSDFALAALADDTGQECPICFEEKPPVATRCGHRYCDGCLQQALARRQSCPACREPLLPQRDVVVVRPPRGPPAAGAVMRRLLEVLWAAPSRTLVVASHGDVHEKLAHWLRRQGRPRTWAWRGNTCRLVAMLKNFRLHPDATLLVDPGALPLHWARFENVERLLLLWPLQRGRLEPCCQLRRVRAALDPGLLVDLLLLTPDCERPLVAGELLALADGCGACQRHGAALLASSGQ